MVRGGFVIAPVARALIEAFPGDYLYGCIAADIIVGKNRASYDVHCHNWQNGLRLQHAARTDASRALAYGFLSHLAADIVAHNYFVPYKIVESYDRRTTRHTYWEIRYEHVIHDDELVWKKFKEIQRIRFPEHDGFLDSNLPGASALFSFRNSRRIFRSAMAVMNTEGWRGFVRGLSRSSPLPLHLAEATEYRTLALAAVSSFMREGSDSSVIRADPVGAQCLRTARHMRTVLRRMETDRRLDADRLRELLPHIRAGFRDSLQGALVLPDLEEAARPIRRTRRHAKVHTRG